MTHCLVTPVERRPHEWDVRLLTMTGVELHTFRITTLCTPYRRLLPREARRRHCGRHAGPTARQLAPHLSDRGWEIQPRRHRNRGRGGVPIVPRYACPVCRAHVVLPDPHRSTALCVGPNPCGWTGTLNDMEAARLGAPATDDDDAPTAPVPVTTDDTAPGGYWRLLDVWHNGLEVDVYVDDDGVLVLSVGTEYRDVAQHFVFAVNDETVHEGATPPWPEDHPRYTPDDYVDDDDEDDDGPAAAEQGADDPDDAAPAENTDAPAEAHADPQGNPWFTPARPVADPAPQRVNMWMPTPAPAEPIDPLTCPIELLPSTAVTTSPETRCA